MLQVLVNPQQVGVVPGREDPDQFRPVNAVIPVSRRCPVSDACPSPRTARRCGPRAAPTSAMTVTPSGLACAEAVVPLRPVNAGAATGSSTSRAAGRPTSTATRS